MKKSILLGNGVNMFLRISSLSTENIAKRFENALLNSSCFYELLFNVSFTKDICKELISYNQNIEKIVGNVYNYIIDHTTCSYNENLYIRLVDELTGTAINAIFFEKYNYIDFSFSSNNLSKLQLYEYIFSLNYIEFWDEHNKSIFLHRKYNLPDIIPDNKPIQFYNRYRYAGNPKYKSLVDSLKSEWQMVEFGCDLLTFAPDCMPKDRVINLGAFPSDTFFGDNDIFPSDPEPLYKELDCISDISVFGVSPYGDSSLIAKLASISQGTIYVFQLNDEEIKEWKKRLPSSFVYKDSKELFD